MIIKKKILDYLNENFNLDDFFDIKLDPTNANIIELVWQDNGTIFATLKKTEIQKLIKLEYGDDAEDEDE